MDDTCSNYFTQQYHPNNSTKQHFGLDKIPILPHAQYEPVKYWIDLYEKYGNYHSKLIASKIQLLQQEFLKKIHIDIPFVADITNVSKYELFTHNLFSFFSKVIEPKLLPIGKPEYFGKIDEYMNGNSSIIIGVIPDGYKSGKKEEKGKKELNEIERGHCILILKSPEGDYSVADSSEFAYVSSIEGCKDIINFIGKVPAEINKDTIDTDTLSILYTKILNFYKISQSKLISLFNPDSLQSLEKKFTESIIGTINLREDDFNIYNEMYNEVTATDKDKLTRVSLLYSFIKERDLKIETLIRENTSIPKEIVQVYNEYHISLSSHHNDITNIINYFKAVGKSLFNDTGIHIIECRHQKRLGVCFFWSQLRHFHREKPNEIFTCMINYAVEKSGVKLAFPTDPDLWNDLVILSIFENYTRADIPELNNSQRNNYRKTLGGRRKRTKRKNPRKYSRKH
jgi:hypothetical protein